MMSAVKQSASETYTNVRESENTKKVESGLSNFFSGAFTKLKNAFGSAKPSSNADDIIKQDAIKAFDDYAIQQEKRKKLWSLSIGFHRNLLIYAHSICFTNYTRNC